MPQREREAEKTESQELKTMMEQSKCNEHNLNGPTEKERERKRERVGGGELERIKQIIGRQVNENHNI